MTFGHSPDLRRISWLAGYSTRRQRIQRLRELEEDRATKARDRIPPDGRIIAERAVKMTAC